jgi:hypothetical protein
MATKDWWTFPLEHILCIVTFWASTKTKSGSGQLVAVATRYVLGDRGDRIPVEVRFSAPCQTGPGTHPSSNTVGSAYFPGVKRPGRGSDHPSPSSAEVKERVGLYLYSPLGLLSLFQGELQFYLLPKLRWRHVRFLNDSGSKSPERAVGLVGRLWTVGPGNRGSILGRNKRVFPSPKRPDKLWGHPGLLFTACWGKPAGAPSLLLTHKFSWCLWGQSYLFQSEFL